MRIPKAAEMKAPSNTPNTNYIIILYSRVFITLYIFGDKCKE